MSTQVHILMIASFSLENRAIVKYVHIHRGFIQGSLSKIQGLFKDFSRIFYSFQGLKV